ncbi:alpha/beta hydrolase [Archangium violaceum]|uniref:alpha/beta fold hydrolase n=1 Tax=Archangium violaceum TaxID=83451 RepID=UPI00193C404C|nr:alpha/beta hydrolase [Archangium violaceum]QRK08845.1 alpha/beta hydrolase [Archangium violaceum]
MKRHNILTRDGVDLFYRDWGTGRPVVFLSGWALCSDMWNYQMVPLSEQGLRCVAYDRRGHGRSSDPGRGYDYDTLADDLAFVLEALDLREVTLVGHSMASGELVRYLTRHGAGRIARLVFVAPAATPFPLKTADNPEGIDASVFEYVRDQLMLRDFPKWLADNARPFVTEETSPEMVEWIMSLMRQCSMKAVIECNRSSTTTDFRAELPRIKLPTLVIHGDKDVSAPLELTGRKTARLIPGSRLEVYEGAPHGLFVTHMDRLNADLLAFARTEG